MARQAMQVGGWGGWMGDGTCRPRLSEGQAGQEEGGGCGGAATRDGVRPAEKGSRDAPTAAAPPRGGRSVPAACRPQCSAVGGGGGGGRCPDPLNTVPPAGCPTQCGGGHALGGGRARGHCKREGASAPSFARVSAWRDLPYSYQTREGVLARVGGGVGGGGWRRPCPFIRQPRPPREPPPTPTRRPPPPPPPAAASCSPPTTLWQWLTPRRGRAEAQSGATLPPPLSSPAPRLFSHRRPSWGPFRPLPRIRRHPASRLLPARPPRLSPSPRPPRIPSFGTRLDPTPAHPLFVPANLPLRPAPPPPTPPAAAATPPRSNVAVGAAGRAVDRGD